VSKRGFTLIELLVVITIIGILVALALPNFIKAKDKALEAEVKSNLHSIQVSLERYATDNGGAYPAYIYGGSLASWRCTLDPGSCMAPMINLPEPMMKYGFLGTYPSNPFVKQGQSNCDMTGGDPRFGCVPDGAGGYIASSGGSMANILSDPNFTNPDDTPGQGAGSWSPAAAPAGSMPYVFVGDGNPQTRDFLPGNFIYRSFGTSAADVRQFQGYAQGMTVQANAYEHYLLSGYGSQRTAGKDWVHCYDNGWNGGNGFESRPEDAGAACPANSNSFDNWTIAQNEPTYGWGDIDGDGDPDVVPNVVFAEGPPGVVTVAEMAPSNSDGQLDGLLLFYNAGTDESVGAE